MITTQKTSGSFPNGLEKNAFAMVNEARISVLEGPGAYFTLAIEAPLERETGA